MPRKVETWAEHEAIRKRFGQDVALAAKDLARARERLARITASADCEWEQQKTAIETRVRHYRERLEADNEKIGAARKELLAWLGLEAGSIYDITRRIAELKMECAADPRVRDVEERLNRARRAMQGALAHLPEREAADLASPWGIPA
jgi:hypothetical protein